MTIKTLKYWTELTFFKAALPTETFYLKFLTAPDQILHLNRQELQSHKAIASKSDCTRASITFKSG